uniref:Uncharacterized protein n=2 Tax=Oryza TaxID=4527 RepID=Q6ERW6_ORYSJ|nr:hypothetical protein [Oryza sativa Japonica Group]BAD28604.1 hypothetical protein [Oryza sativa Japonica Group]
MAHHERELVDEVDVEARGGGGRQRAAAAAAAGERMRLTWSCLAMAVLLVWCAVVFHPAHARAAVDGARRPRPPRHRARRLALPLHLWQVRPPRSLCAVQVAAER